MARVIRQLSKKPGVDSREEQTKDKRTYYLRYSEAKDAMKRAEEYGNKNLEIKVNPRTGKFYLERVGFVSSPDDEK